MKRLILVTVIFIWATTIGRAQRYADLAVHQISPNISQILEFGQPLLIKYKINNYGVDSLLPTDIIKVKWIIDNSVLLVDNGTSLDSFFTFTGYMIAPNDSMEVSTPPTYLMFTGNYEFCTSISLQLNAVNPILDTLLLNNIDCDRIEVNPVGLSASPNASNVSLFPNPARQQLHISGIDKSKNVTYTLFDCFGTQLLFYQGSNQVLDLSNISAGLYNLRISIDGVSFVKKFIKIE
jgi:hypothetical protein